MKKMMVITGGTRGIGRALVEKFYHNGFEIATCSRTEQNLAQLRADFPGIHTFQADVSSEESVRSFIAFILSLQIPVQALINNAGVFIPGNILEDSIENFTTQINTNLYSAYRMTRGLITHLKEQTTAHIFNIVSVAALQAYPRSGAYSVSKFALLGFSKAIRQELLETNVKVTAVLPGATFTDSWLGTDIPPQRFMTTQDVADMVWAAFSLSPTTVVEELLLRPLKGDL